MRTDEIQIRDPFIVVEKEEYRYYLFGSTDKEVWGAGHSFEAYYSADLKNWNGPYTAFLPDKEFWSNFNFWAPEVHEYRGKYYMFASFKMPEVCRGSQILVSDTILGPYRPLTQKPITPRDWECLDATLYIDKNGKPYMVFCREWVQVCDGEIYYMALSDDLKKPISEPKRMFKASDALWSAPFESELHPGKGCYVTDGPFFYRGCTGDLYMLWSTNGYEGYTIGVAKSDNGEITGCFVQEENPLFGKDGGHGMLFETLDGRLMLTIHSPNQTPNERPVFFPIVEEAGRLILK